MGRERKKKSKNIVGPEETASLVFSRNQISTPNVSCLFSSPPKKYALDFGKVRLRELLDALVNGREDGAAGVDAGRLEGSSSGHGFRQREFRSAEMASKTGER